MALEIYLSTTKQKIASLESTSEIKNQINVLEKKTGVIIDEYGKTILYLDHIKFLESLINEENTWKSTLRNAIDQNSNLIIEGD